MTPIEKLFTKPDALSLKDELSFMLSWDRSRPPHTRGYIIPNFLSGDYRLEDAYKNSRKVTIRIEI